VHSAEGAAVFLLFMAYFDAKRRSRRPACGEGAYCARAAALRCSCRAQEPEYGELC
jgi:hypothetical protein